MTDPLAADLDHVLEHTRPLWEDLRGRRIFITGGGGFVGRWLLESLVWANDHLDLDAEAVVLTRNPSAFQQRLPQLASHRAVRLWTGDVRSFNFPDGAFSCVIHGAANASGRMKAEEPLLVFDTIIQGTRRTLDFACHAGVKRFLFLSSGAVYGRQPPELSHVPEDYVGCPDPLAPGAAYAEAKRAGELLCSLYTRSQGIEASIARCFAFVGRYLPLDSELAVGNFIGDALKRRPIVVQGDGTPYRSYLYAADLAIWLWTILFRGAPARAYNVGSEEAVTIADLARMVADAVAPAMPVRIMGKPDAGRLPERYVPSTRRAAQELGLRPLIGLKEGIRRTVGA